METTPGACFTLKFSSAQRGEKQQQQQQQKLCEDKGIGTWGHTLGGCFTLKCSSAQRENEEKFD
jgi:hypothetical protein